MISSPEDFPITARAVSSFHHLEEASSTNTIIRQMDPQPEPYTLVMTTNQTEGRGRLGRRWVGSSGDMVALSIVLPPTSTNVFTLVPLIVGACLTTALQEHGARAATLKWPNDVLVEGRKLAGILCEVLPDSSVIAGAGLNLEFPIEPPAPLAISLAQCGVDPHTTLDSIVGRWVDLLRQWIAAPHSDQVRFVTANTSTLGLFVEVSHPDGTSLRGIAEDISPEGHLLVRVGTESTLTSVVAADIEHLYQ
jgi:BirA family transcriptional regulator, biotin operon repressor / biotin---[acetyl-CoA-carboxylase] ligase